MKEKYEILFNDDQFKEDALSFVKVHKENLNMQNLLPVWAYYGSFVVTLLISIVWCLNNISVEHAGISKVIIIIMNMFGIVPLIIWFIKSRQIALETTICQIESSNNIDEILSILEKIITVKYSFDESSAYYRLIDPCNVVSFIRNNTLLELHKAGPFAVIVCADKSNNLHEHYYRIHNFQTAFLGDNEFLFSNQGITYTEVHIKQPSTIFEKITEIRQELNLSEEQFAKNLGITVDNLHYINDEERIIIGMEREYNVNPDWLRGKSDTKYCELSLHEKAARTGGSILAENDMEKRKLLLKLGGVEEVPGMDFDVQVIETLANILKNDDKEKLTALINFGRCFYL